MSANAPAGSFIDTNILVYAFDRSAERKHSLAAQLLERCWEEENGCISIQVLQEFYVTVTRKISAPLDASTARQIVADLGQWRCHVPEAADVLQAIDFQQAYQLSFWDAQVLQSASRMGCKQLYSEDFTHGQVYGEVRVVNPFLEGE